MIILNCLLQSRSVRRINSTAIHQKKDHAVKHVTPLTCRKLSFTDGANNHDLWSPRDSQNTSLAAECGSHPSKIELFPH